MATGKMRMNCYSLTESWELGQEVGNSELWIEHDCVVTMHDAYTNEDLTISTDFHNV